MRVNGELKDLAASTTDADTVEPVTIDSPDGLNILRHSAAHVMAQAVQSINPEAKLGIGPPVQDGFYYDFDVAEAFQPEDLKAIEKAMDRIIRQGQRFERRVVTEDEARAELANEPYKLELIGLKGSVSDASDDGETVEVGGAELTIYDNVDGKTGEVYWKDLCRGPHLPNTRMIGNGWALVRNAAAYWRGSEKNKQLQRIYGTAWPTKDELRAYQERLGGGREARPPQARRRARPVLVPRRRSAPALVGVAPAGAASCARRSSSTRCERHREAGYALRLHPAHHQEGPVRAVRPPRDYKEGMFPPMHLDEERDADGNITKQGQDYYLKPMNCPFHILIYKERGRSYRDLPLRLASSAPCTATRCPAPCTASPACAASPRTTRTSSSPPTSSRRRSPRRSSSCSRMLRDFGLDDFYLELSTRDDEK